MIRIKEHLRSKTERANLDYHIMGLRNKTRIEARIWEQMKINEYGMIKNGGMLFNKRNEIAPKYWNLFDIY